MSQQSGALLFKIRLEGGRVLGPIGLERIRALILSQHIRGTEQAREHPVGEWREIGSIPEIAALLLANAQGVLAEFPIEGPKEGAAGVDLGAATQILPPTEPLPRPEPTQEVRPSPEESQDRTQVATLDDREPQSSRETEPEDKTRVAEPGSDARPLELDVGAQRAVQAPASIANERTVVFARSDSSPALPGRASTRKTEWVRTLLILGMVILIGIEFMKDDEEARRAQKQQVRKIRPYLPSAGEARPDPIRSQERYLRALSFYQEDTISGYRRAVESLHGALAADPDNVRALAMLASSYLNLIDVSNKDEKYFDVISKLIDQSRSKNLDLPETLIADAEYLTLTGRPLAAQTRIIEYSKKNKGYSNIIVLYLAQAFLARGEAGQAARYTAELTSLQGVDAKLHYVRGQIAESLGDLEAASSEYKATIKTSPRHGYARYRLVKIANAREKLQEVRKELEFVTASAEHLAPRELADAYSIRAKLDQQAGRFDLALGHIERALRLEPENPDYNLAYFTLRARAGDQLPEVRKEARLYYFMAESERLLREGQVERAQLALIEARRESPGNPQPLVRLGNLFYVFKGDVLNAKINFRKAAELSPGDIRIWGRYIELLIQSYEWEEANRALGRFKSLPVPQSAIDKATADWFAKQGRHAEAREHYQKALSREYIEPSVYLAYGKSLIESQKYQEAPFIFALALRYEPDNPEAVIGTARAILGEEGIDRAISYLRDELQKGGATRVELLCGLADFLIQKGSWDEAMSFIEQAKAARPDMALPFKIEAQFHAAKPTGGKQGADRRSKEKMLQSYQSYLDRNPSDAGILFERYKVLVELGEYGAADADLQRIYELYPRYPSLHFSKGRIYVRLGNLKAAQKEYELELANGNSSLPVLLALGSVHLELKEHDKALEYFVKGMQRAPKESEPKQMSGYANFLLRRYDAAVALYREALKLDEGNPIIYRRLGDAYRALGDAANTRWAYQKYLEMEPDAVDKAELQRFF